LALGCSDDGSNRGGPGAGATGGDALIGGSAGKGGDTGSGGEAGDTGEAGSGGTSGSGGGGDGPVVLSRLMSRAADCDDLTTALQDEISARFERMVAPPSGSGGSGGGAWGSGGSFGAAGSFGTGGASSGGGSGNIGSGGSAGGGSGDPVFTGTNTQIPGVDEPDFIKTDGTHMFILQQRTLHVATAYPASSLAPLTSIAVEGQAFEMFLAEGATADERRIAIYSGVGNPDPANMQESYGFVKLTVFRFAGGELSVESENFFEDDYVSTHHQDNQMQTMFNVYQQVPNLRT